MKLISYHIKHQYCVNLMILVNKINRTTPKTVLLAHKTYQIVLKHVLNRTVRVVRLLHVSDALIKFVFLEIVF